MSFIAVAFLYPLLLAVLSVGAGLVVESLAGFRLPSALLPAGGFAALLVVSQFTVLSSTLAPATPWFLVALALLGYGLGRKSIRGRWVDRRAGWWWAPAAAVAAYVTVALPLIAAGRLTFPGYLLDTTAGFHLSVGEWILHHGDALPPAYPAFGAAIHDYFGNGYPAGGQVLVAATGWLSGQNMLWVYFPFQVFAVSTSGLVLSYVARRAGLPQAAAAFTGWIAAVPALVTAYTQMGSIKELTGLPALVLMGAVVVSARRHAKAGIRGAIPFAVAGAAAIAAIGPAAAAWIGVFGLGALLFILPPLIGPGMRLRRADSRTLINVGALGLAVIAFLAVFSIPTLTRLASTVNTALSFTGSNSVAANDPGNLVRPLRWVQAFGVWLGGSHRVDPQYVDETYALIGITILAFALGAVWLIARRRWSILALLAGSIIVWIVLTKRGTEWTDAKVLMLTSPVVMTVALIGAFGGFGAGRIPGLLLALVIGGGVLASDALLYHGTNLAPTGRYRELLTIGQRFAGEGPTLVPDFDEYAFYALRKLRIDGPGFAGDMRGPFSLFGAPPGYGHSYDPDSIEAPSLQRFDLIVIRRSPRWSRPPSNYALAWSGSYYDVWRRAGSPPVLHVPAGGGLQASGVLSCRVIRRTARQAAQSGHELRYGARPLNVTASLTRAKHSPSVVGASDFAGLPSVSFSGPGQLTATVSVQASGTYGLWLGANLDRALSVLVDGRPVGAPSQQSGGDGNMIRVASVKLTAGPHTIRLVRGGGSLAPDDNAGNVLDGIFLAPVVADGERVITLPPRAWRSLCGRELDWLEIA